MTSNKHNCMWSGIGNQELLFSPTLVSMFTLFQLRVVASDGGTPPLLATTVVEVHINRNLQAPRFPSTNYRPEILETQQLGLAFVRVRAGDADNKVRWHISEVDFCGFIYRTVA